MWKAISVFVLVLYFFFHPFLMVKGRWKTNKNAALIYLGIGIILLILALSKMVDNTLRYNCTAKQSEAKNTLKTIFNLQQKYLNKNNMYAEDINELDFNPKSMMYTYAFNKKKVADADIEIPKEGFIAVAESQHPSGPGGLDNDLVQDVWVINHKGRLINVINDCTNLSKAHELK